MRLLRITPRSLTSVFLFKEMTPLIFIIVMESVKICVGSGVSFIKLMMEDEFTMGVFMVGIKYCFPLPYKFIMLIELPFPN